MSDILLNELAKELSKTPETLVKQFADAGITKSTSDKVSLQEKETLTVYLQKQHGGEQNATPKRIIGIHYHGLLYWTACRNSVLRLRHAGSPTKYPGHDRMSHSLGGIS